MINLSSWKRERNRVGLPLVGLLVAIASGCCAQALCDDSPFERELQANIAKALIAGDDAAIEAEVAKALDYDLQRGDDDAEDELEDGIEQALRESGKTVSDATEDAIEASIERAYYKGLRNARDAASVQSSVKAVKDAVKATFEKYNGGSAKPAATPAPATPAPANGVVDPKLKASLDRAFAGGDEDAFEDAVESAVAESLKNGDDASLKYALDKAIAYDVASGDDDACGAVEDGVELALRALGKRVTDRVEDAIENSVERAGRSALRDARRGPQAAETAAKAFLHVVKSTFEKYNGGPVARRPVQAPATPAAPAPNSLNEELDEALASGDEDLIENAVKSAVARALTTRNDAALEDAIVKAIGYDLSRADDDAEDELEDGVERALRASGKVVTELDEDEIEAAIERVYYKELRNARRDSDALNEAAKAVKKAVKAAFDTFNTNDGRSAGTRPTPTSVEASAIINAPMNPAGLDMFNYTIPS